MAQPSEIFTVAEIRAADAAAIRSGVPGRLLMERAGEGVVQAMLARWAKRPVLVLAGPGANGGDGYVIARLLAKAGWPVEVAASPGPAGLSGDAALAAADWAGPVGDLATARAPAGGLVVDALFGAGLSRPLDKAVQAVLRAVENSGAEIVAVDLPSGLAGDTGRALGYAPRARLTVTFHAKKPAHVLEPGRGLCGEVEVVDIGIPRALAPAARTFENSPALWLEAFPWPKSDVHKHRRGRLVVVSGGIASTGAARLAARAGLRIGAGLVTVLSPTAALAVNAAQLEAVMVQPFETEAELQRAAADADAAVIGPGAGVNNATTLNMLALGKTGAALVVDADGLTAFREEPEALFSILDRDDVLTPHVGEFERIFPGLLEQSPERITAARTASERAGAVVLLKGPDTVIAAPDGRAVVNTHATPWLATAGSGDVLAGFIAGLIAQGLDSFEAACAGAWIHGDAGRRFGPGLISEDLPETAPAVLRDLLSRTV